MNIADKVQVADTTTGTSTSITGRYPPKVEQGWECPRCGRINAPWVRQCDCSVNNWTITSDLTYKPDWWKEVTCNPDTFKIHPDTVTWKTPSSVCQSDSSTTKSNPNITTYVTGYSSIVGGSDYWDNTEKIWCNTLKNISNIKEIY